MFVPCYYDIFDWIIVVTIILIDPLKQVIKRVLISDVKQKNAAVCSSVVGSSYSFIPFLTCCVPHLQLHSLIFVIKSPTLAIDSYCSFISFIPFIHGGPQKQRCFPTAGISNDYDFKEVVIG